MANNKKQISIRLPPNIYSNLIDFLDSSELTLTQATTYAISTFIKEEREMKLLTNDSRIDDLQIDLEDVLDLLEKIDLRLSRVEEGLRTRRQIDLHFTRSEYASIAKFVEENKKFRLKEIIEAIGLEPENRSIQVRLSFLLRKMGLTKVRRRIPKIGYTYFWLKKQK